MSSDPMKLYVGVTDNDCYRFLRQLPNVDEVNFWQPGGRQPFERLKPGELFVRRDRGQTFRFSTISPFENSQKIEMSERNGCAGQSQRQDASQAIAEKERQEQKKEGEGGNSETSKWRLEEEKGIKPSLDRGEAA